MAVLWAGRYLVFSGIYVSKMEEDIVITANPILYKRYVDDTYVRRKEHETDKIFIDLNSYHVNIKLTLEINPNKFLDTEIIRNDQGIRRKFIANQKSFQCIGLRKFLIGTKEMQLQVNCRWTLMMKQKGLEVNTQTQDTQNMLLRMLSRIIKTF